MSEKRKNKNDLLNTVKNQHPKNVKMGEFSDVLPVLYLFVFSPFISEKKAYREIALDVTILLVNNSHSIFTFESKFLNRHIAYIKILAKNKTFLLLVSKKTKNIFLNTL